MLGALRRIARSEGHSVVWVHRVVIVGLVVAVLVSINLAQPAGTRRWEAVTLTVAAMLIALSLGRHRVWPVWRSLGGVLAAVLLAILFAATGGTDSVYQDTAVAVLVVSALTLPLRLVVINSVAAVLAVASPWLYDPDVDAIYLADLVADVGVWLAVTVAVYLQTRQLHRQTARLEESDELRVAFLRATSHELRTPLTAVVGFADTLERLGDRLSAEERQRVVGQLTHNARRLSSLIEDLLDVDRLTSGLVVATRSRQDLAELVRNVVADLDPADHRLELALEPTVGYVDVPKFERVIANLVSNALRHNAPGATVRIELGRDARGIVFAVVDNGGGIPDGFEQRIFEPFVQGPRQRAAAQPGTGLGLALVREFVALHDGTVDARNEPGGGARFEVVLPSGVPPDTDNGSMARAEADA